MDVYLTGVWVSLDQALATFDPYGLSHGCVGVITIAATEVSRLTFVPQGRGCHHHTMTFRRFSLNNNELITPAMELVLEAADESEPETTEDSIVGDPPTDNEPGEDDELVDEILEDEPKFELTDETIEFRGRTLHRICALKDFGNVHIGQFGGYVEDSYNLSHKGNCWIYDNAIVMDKADVRDDAQVRGEAVVCDSACICEKAKVLDQTWVCDQTLVGGEAMVRDFAVVCGDSYIRGNAQVYNCAFVMKATVDHYGCVKNYALVIETDILDHAYIFDNAIVCVDTPLDGVMTRIGNDTKLIQDAVLEAIVPDRTIPNGAFLRCSLKGLACEDNLGGASEEILQLAEEMGDTSYKITVDPENPNLYRVDIYPNIPLILYPYTVDPTARVHVLYSDVHVCDVPSLVWGEEFVGSTDTVTIKVTNPAFHGTERTYTLQVNVLETPEWLLPEEEPEEPPIELVDLDVKGFKFLTGIDGDEIEGIRYTVDPHDDSVYYILIPREMTMYIVPELVDDKAQWHLEYWEIDITDAPLRCDTYLDKPVMVHVTDPNDPERTQVYELNIRIGYEP